MGLKGIDDALAAGIDPQVLNGADVESHISACLISSGAELAWPEPKPVPDPIPSAPSLGDDFAKDMIPPPILQWSRDISQRLGVALESVAGAAFCVFGSIIGTKVGVQPRRHADWLVLPVLWYMLVGRPSSKKTPLMSEVLQVVAHLESLAQLDYEQKLPAHKAAIIRSKAEIDALKERLREAAKGRKISEADAIQKEIEDREREADGLKLFERRYRVNDTTTEKLGELLVQNPNGILEYRDELAGLFQSFQKPGREGDRPFFLEAWNGTGSYTYDRIGRGSTRIPFHCVSILGAIQPGKLMPHIVGLAQGGADDDGMFQRFQLGLFPDKHDGIAQDIAPDLAARERVLRVAERLDSLDPSIIGAIQRSGKRIPSLKFAEEAQNIFDEWLGDLESRLQETDALEPVMEAHLNKFRSLLPALALVDHLVSWADGSADGSAIGSSSVERARDWCDLLEGHAKKIYGFAINSGAHRAHMLMCRIKRGDVKDGAKLRDIHRNQWTLLRTSEEVGTALLVLEEAGWVRTESRKASSGGGQSVLVRLHPSLRGKS